MFKFVHGAEGCWKVSLMEDADQNIHLKNLSVHQAGSEEDSLNLLFMGDTNRMIAETPMNQASSRSHCIFTVHLTSKQEGSATIRKAKLHLVDLAGSERVAKTGVNGTLLTEAKYINLSLHYLEQVIIALSEKSRSHIPYRNSMMTSVLRDSLGGNCMTTMIATCSMEKRSMDESISTCRFAQRVAMIKNDVTLNEELDPRLLIAKLKRDNAELREQVALATGEQLSEELSQEEIDRCEEAVRLYLDDPDPESVLTVGHDLRKIQKCFRILKRFVLERPPAADPVQSNPMMREATPDIGPYRDTETRKLKELVEQRDNEINILVNMLKKERQKGKGTIANRPATRHSNHSSSQRREGNPERVNGYYSQGEKPSASAEGQRLSSTHQDRPDSESRVDQQRQSRQHRSSVAAIDKEDRMKTKILGNMSLGRQEAFDIFMRDYHDRDRIDMNKQILKQRYGEAKLLGEKLNKSKQKMNHLKNSLAQIRTHQEMEGQDGESVIEREIKEQMEDEKNIYKDTFTSLRAMKSEIEHLQHFLEKSKVQLMKDFELWWAEQTARNHQLVWPEVPPPGPSGQSVMAAWKTPPITPPTPAPIPGPPSHRTFTRETPSPDIRGSNSRQERPPIKPSIGGFMLTGDSKVDADIQAFVKARQSILQKVQENHRGQ
ncbi:kinesin-like protein KIF6 [Aplysia californica]|uniref:Kinesin-like protein n=1 Tax=Aplysia californica TaxID=6500 RepID=A0ABM1A0I9_APLCA|nr:kinesin-like protein KIF6 [Aplysia californica]